MSPTENFNAAATLKGKLQSIHGLTAKFIEAEDGMRKSAKEENHKDASRFKKQRDVALNDVVKALDDAEQPEHYANDNVISPAKKEFRHVSFTR